ncbi:MAG: four helix bundle protein [Candidatus Zambryskibacteria bacterium]|nr:four helix bundle protein [Candidatus Zambryskibacteria bacterium]
MEERAKIKDFTDLETWKKSHELVLAIYKATRDFPRSETFALTSQIQRAAVSITSNIAEGFGRQTIKEKVQFYYQAQGSLTEVKNQLILSKDLHYISEPEFDRIMDTLITSHKLLQGLLRKTKSFLIPKS